MRVIHVSFTRLIFSSTPKTQFNRPNAYKLSVFHPKSDQVCRYRKNPKLYIICLIIIYTFRFSYELKLKSSKLSLSLSLILFSNVSKEFASLPLPYFNTANIPNRDREHLSLIISSQIDDENCPCPTLFIPKSKGKLHVLLYASYTHTLTDEFLGKRFFFPQTSEKKIGAQTFCSLCELCSWQIKITKVGGKSIGKTFFVL